MFAPAELTKADISILFPSEWRIIKVEELQELQDQLRRANLELEEYKNNIRNSTSQDINKNREHLQMFIRNF